MTVEIISSSKSMGLGHDRTSDPLDLQSDSHLLPDPLPTAQYLELTKLTIFKYDKWLMQQSLNKTLYKIYNLVVNRCVISKHLS